MHLSQNEILLRRAFAPARGLEPDPSEIAAVVSRAASPRTHDRPHLVRRARWSPRARTVTPALAALALLLACAYAVPSTRAAIDDAASTVAGVFDGWRGEGSADAPGRALKADEPAPSYFREGAWSEAHVMDPRVIGEAGGYKLFAYRERSGTIGFDLGDTGVGLGGYNAADFDGRPICLLGPGTTDDSDPNGPHPYFGVTASDTAIVELRYETGPAERTEAGAGGFVLLVDRSREPDSITAFDATGAVLGRVAVSGAELVGAGSDYC